MTVAALTGCSFAVAPPVTAQDGSQDASAAPSYVSRPDLTPPEITVHDTSRRATPGLTLLCPKVDSPGPPRSDTGALMVDEKGEPVWFMPNKSATNPLGRVLLQEQKYRGEDVLTYFDTDGSGGRWILVDESYQQIATVRAGNGFRTGAHDMKITPWNTALMLATRNVDREVDGKVIPVAEYIIQEVDIASGDVVWEWHSLDHIDPSESYFPPDKPSPPPVVGAFNYLHINSVSVDPVDGNLLVSGRHTSAVYKIDHKTGEVMWRLGGKKNDFEIGEGASFAWQHDPQRERDGSISLLDNNIDPYGTGPREETENPVSRGMVLDVDEKRKTARLKTSYPSPDKLLTATQGSMQVLPDGNALVGWGVDGYWTEFSRKGKVLSNFSFADDALNSYRSVWADWEGVPDERPAVAGRETADGTKVYASWNGATEVAGWRVKAGDSPSRLKPVEWNRKTGFETSVPLNREAEYVAVQALDKRGRVLGTSEAVPVE